MAEEAKPLFDFSSLDSVMMLMTYGATQLIDNKLSVERKASLIAEFYAIFLGLRTIHEQSHVAKKSVTCPFCQSLELSLAMNRTQASG
jgi:hypothetical protein